MAALGKVVITLTVRCENCGGSLSVSSPVNWDGQALVTADLLGSERTFLTLFAETHVGPFVATAEA